MNLVELELDETLADFEVQDWIDNVFSVQYPDVKARIKKGCNGLCHKKDDWHYVKDGDYPEEYKDLWICFITEDDTKDYVRGWYEYDFDNEKHIFKYVDIFGTQYLKDVYAWEELVPPNIKEGE